MPEDELERLKEKNRAQGRQIAYLQDRLRAKSLDLDAMHFVWCDGGCASGVHRFSDVVLTKEMILRAQRNTRRLSSWYNTVKWRLKGYPTMDEWHNRYARRAAAKTDLIIEIGSSDGRD